ncbi:MAG TPA: type II secretion system protein [Vibrio sp.]|uniref:type II secretion system protein n=1 Tax=Vibrio TaxID=662 RepID=UPI0004107E4C|nr:MULTISPECIES: type II secretion system protein [Vibrio]HCH01525.1 type II secretion system protein [Vibrio sp.]
MKKQNGFTLIELVVVIVILGILAVTAAPKFLNLQDDAKVSAVKGLAGAMKGAAGITYGKAAVAGEESKETGNIMVNGVSTAVTYGYPQATSASLGAVVDGLDTDWVENPNTTVLHPGADVAYGYEGFNCIVTYTEAQSANEPAKVEVKGSAEGCEIDN